MHQTKPLLLFLIDVYRKTLKSDGIQGLYRGFTISAVGIFIYRGMYFGLYDSLKPILLGGDPSLVLSFLLGWGVTITSGLMSYPIDTIRRRMMMTSGNELLIYLQRSQSVNPHICSSIYLTLWKVPLCKLIKAGGRCKNLVRPALKDLDQLECLVKPSL